MSIEKYNLTAKRSDLNKYCHLAEENDFIEITE